MAYFKTFLKSIAENLETQRLISVFCGGYAAIRVLRRICCNGQKSFSFRSAKLWNKLNIQKNFAPFLKACKKSLGS